MFLPPPHLSGQTIPVTTPIPGLVATNTITTTNGSSSIVSSGASADSSGNIFNVGMLTANSLVTAPASTPPTATAQGLATILVATSGNSSTSPVMGTLACWTSTGYAQTCPASATTGVIGIVAANPTVYNLVNYVQIVRMGTAACQFTSATAGDYVIASATSGQCADAGSTYPSTAQVVGTVVSGSTTSGYYVFTMNDQQTLPTILSGTNTWTGAQNFSGATSVTLPFFATLSSFTGVQGDIGYDSTSRRYLVGTGTSTGDPVLVISTSPLSTTSIPTGDTLCWATGPPGCSRGGSTLTYFLTTVPLATGFFSVPGRTVRVTYDLSINTGSSGTPSASFALAYNSASLSSPSALYTSAAPNALPTSRTYQKVQIVCTVTAQAAASTSALLYGNCISGFVGSSAGAFPLLSYDTLGVVSTVDTTDTGESLDLGILFTGTTASATDNVTLLSVIPEFIQ